MMKLMYWETHSWTVSLASLDILAFAGSDFFMMRLTLAMGRNLSCSFEELTSDDMSPDEGLPSGLLLLLFPVMEAGENLWGKIKKYVGAEIVESNVREFGLLSLQKWGKIKK